MTSDVTRDRLLAAVTAMFGEYPVVAKDGLLTHEEAADRLLAGSHLITSDDPAYRAGLALERLPDRTDIVVVRLVGDPERAWNVHMLGKIGRGDTFDAALAALTGPSDV